MKRAGADVDKMSDVKILEKQGGWDVPPEIIFYSAHNGYGSRFLVGYINLKTGRAMEPHFEYTKSLEAYPAFDPISGLALVTYKYRGQNGTELTREGWINEDGVFVILNKKEESVW